MSEQTFTFLEQENKKKRTKSATKFRYPRRIKKKEAPAEGDGDIENADPANDESPLALKKQRTSVVSRSSIDHEGSSD